MADLGKIAIVGLGRMGQGIVRRLLNAHIPTVVSNRSQGPLDEFAKLGAIPAKDGEEIAQKLEKPRVYWSMLPQGDVTENALLGSEGIIHYLEKGDIVIDGGNANYHDSVRRAKIFQEKGIHFLDIGTSGGLQGAEKGYCLMVGGPKEAFDHAEPLLKVIAQDQGYSYIGPTGSGHFVKMVHNAIEYGVMESFGEGLALIKNGPYQEVDFVKLLNTWNHGSIVESFLGRILQQELANDPSLDSYTGEIGYTGEAVWTLEEAKRQKTKVQVIEDSLQIRFDSPQTKSFANKVVAALRHGFGGHTNKERG